MHWITILGILLIAVGTILTPFGQNISNKSDIDKLDDSITEKNSKIEELIKGKNELIEKVDKYQHDLFNKEKTINQLEAEVAKLNITAPKLLPDGRIAATPHIFMSSEFSEGINSARNLFNQGKYKEAYRIADGLRKKNPNFGLAYFIIGTIEIQNGDIEKGEKSLEQAIQLELPEGDKAWAFHNLGISALKKQNFSRAVDYLKRAIQVNPEMEDSKKTLKSIEDQLGKN